MIPEELEECTSMGIPKPMWGEGLRVVTSDGIKDISELQKGDKILTNEGFTEIIEVSLQKQ